MNEPMGWLEAAILGVVQGLTEFLPISSSGHVLIVSRLFGWGDPGAAFTAVTQIGTEIAVLIYFRRDLARILSTWFVSLRRPEVRGSIDARMGWYVIIGTLPIAILGFTFAPVIETAARNLWLVATVLIVFGIVLGLVDRWGAKIKALEALNAKDGLLFGFGQALALIPGVSRSGATISVGLAMGYSRSAATRYAFLLAIPAVLASGLYEATKIGSDVNAQWGQTFLATIIALTIGYLVIAWLIRWVSTHSFLPFVIYRVVLGSMLLVLLATGTISAL